MSTVALLRIELYKLMYEVAREHRDLANQASSRKDIRMEIKESMISILFSYTCLEAYLNALGKDRLGSEWNEIEHDKRISLESKLKLVSSRLATQQMGRRCSIFSKKDQLLKSLRELTEIRKHYLVHWNAEFRRAVNHTPEATHKLNYRKAEWACDIIKQIVTKLNCKINNRDSLEWLDG
jgi:hypothetical protein